MQRPEQSPLRPSGFRPALLHCFARPNASRKSLACLLLRSLAIGLPIGLAGTSQAIQREGVESFLAPTFPLPSTWVRSSSATPPPPWSSSHAQISTNSWQVIVPDGRDPFAWQAATQGPLPPTPPWIAQSGESFLPSPAWAFPSQDDAKTQIIRLAAAQEPVVTPPQLPPSVTLSDPHSPATAAALPKVRGLGRAITVNGLPYPDVSNQFPNAFAQDTKYRFGVALQGVSKTRPCDSNGRGFLSCSDGEFYLDFYPLRGENYSLGLEWGVQSLSSRGGGTGVLQGQNLGFKLAWNIDNLTAISFGAEHAIFLDNSFDLGHNYYLLISRAQPLNSSPSAPLFIGTFGLGSDYYGWRGNGVIRPLTCGTQSVTSTNYPKGSDCKVGFIGSAALAFNQRVTLGIEWYGYGLGVGASFKPWVSIPLNLSLYLTDFLGDFPAYISEDCNPSPCKPRLYGRIGYSF